jgi:type IV pilus biogenesis protein CpaD/CtpE
MGPQQLNKETNMRAVLFVIVAVFIAGCASAPASQPSQKIAVYDHRNMVTKYVDRSNESNFVGTSAKEKSATKTQPSWYRFGHP